MSKDLSRFIDAEFPKVKKLYEITTKMLQSYLDSKKDTCTDATLKKIYSRIVKLDKVFKHTYHNTSFVWKVEKVSRPISTKTDGYKKDKPMPKDVGLEIIKEMSHKRSEAYRAVCLSFACGLRANEAVNMKVENIRLDGKGAFGFGTVDVLAGSKGGRVRYGVPIVSKEGLEAVKAAIQGKAPHEYVAARSDGKRMTPENVQRALRETMDKMYGKGFMCGNRAHAYRKLFAQTAYDLLRNHGQSNQSAIGHTNRWLGHSAKRQDIIRAYVQNLH